MRTAEGPVPLMSLGCACRSCRPASRMRSGSCEASFPHGTLGTALQTTTSGAPASWRYRAPPAAMIPPSAPRAKGLLLAVVLAWSGWEGVAGWSRGQCRKQVRKLPLLCSLGLLAPFPAPALLALPSFSSAALAPEPFRGVGS